MPRPRPQLLIGRHAIDNAQPLFFQHTDHAEAFFNVQQHPMRRREPMRHRGTGTDQNTQRLAGIDLSRQDLYRKVNVRELWLRQEQRYHCTRVHALLWQQRQQLAEHVARLIMLVCKKKEERRATSIRKEATSCTCCCLLHDSQHAPWCPRLVSVAGHIRMLRKRKKMRGHRHAIASANDHPLTTIYIHI